MRKKVGSYAALLLIAWIATATKARADGPFQVRTIAPCRAVDTRPGSPLMGGETRDFPIIGVCAIPATAKAAFMNVAVVATTGSGFVRLWAAGTTMPSTSTITFDAAEPAISNGTLVPLSQGVNSISLLYQSGPQFQGHIVIDVVGYLE
jgi:hypothetical protein